MQHAGGMLLPPVRKLVVTYIFVLYGQKCKSIPLGSTNKKATHRVAQTVETPCFASSKTGGFLRSRQGQGKLSLLLEFILSCFARQGQMDFLCIPSYINPFLPYEAVPSFFSIFHSAEISSTTKRQCVDPWLRFRRFLKPSSGNNV